MRFSKRAVLNCRDQKKRRMLWHSPPVLATPAASLADDAEVGGAHVNVLLGGVTNIKLPDGDEHCEGAALMNDEEYLIVTEEGHLLVPDHGHSSWEILGVRLGWALNLRPFLRDTVSVLHSLLTN